MSNAPLKKLAWRSFTSVLLGIIFIAMAISGAILFLAPPGRVANWTGWNIWGLTKHDWGSVHITFSAVFLLAAVLHLIFNWRPMVGYFKDRLTRRIGFRREWALALACGGFIFVGTRANWVPFSWLVAASEDLRMSWDKPQERAPIPHAELLSLAELARQAGVDFLLATNRLVSRGFTNLAAETVVAALAAQHHVTAQEVYGFMTDAARGRGRGAGGAGREGGTNEVSSASAGGHQGGGGMGWKTLKEYCEAEKLDLTATLARLHEKGLKAEPTQTLREIAVNNGYQRPYEIVEFLRGNTSVLKR
jgi:Domain of unknown function (DUF4405)